MTVDCKHKFIYGGVKYEDGTESLPGGSAKRRTYFDWFYCEKCIGDTYKPLSTFEETTFDEVKFGASPKSRK